MLSIVMYTVVNLEIYTQLGAVPLLVEPFLLPSPSLLFLSPSLSYPITPTYLFSQPLPLFPPLSPLPPPLNRGSS